ncbi:hypothetical protein LZ30DRAFT_696749 [Colletotrichum cereale]|nr:hypothetical protein LZ30DRAFT_696749 [Colletotrichum cereale]
MTFSLCFVFVLFIHIFEHCCLPLSFRTSVPRGGRSNNRWQKVEGSDAGDAERLGACATTDVMCDGKPHTPQTGRPFYRRDEYLPSPSGGGENTMTCCSPARLGAVRAHAHGVWRCVRVGMETSIFDTSFF